MHVAPFSHGSEEHSSMSVSQCVPLILSINKANTYSIEFFINKTCIDFAMEYRKYMITVIN